MGPSGGPRRHRRRVALAVALLVVGIPAMARSASPRASSPGPVTSLVVRGNTVEVAALPSGALVEIEAIATVST